MKRPIANILTFLIILILGFIVVFYFRAGLPTGDGLYPTEISYYKNKPKIISNDDTLSIISFNIGYLSGMTNNKAVVPNWQQHIENNQIAREFFNMENSDFIAFQEVDFNSKRSFLINQFDSIGKYVGFTQGAYSINWDKKYVPFPYWPISTHFGKVLSGQGILSKFPVLSNERIVLPKPKNNPFYYNAFYLDRLIQIVKVNLGHSILVIINVHFEAFDIETRNLQIEIISEISGIYLGSNPVILLGDFNIPPEHKIRNLSNYSLFQVLNKVGMEPAISEEKYFNNPSEFFTFNSENPYEKIDYIFYDPNTIRLIESTVLSGAGEISDHLPMMMKFLIKKD